MVLDYTWLKSTLNSMIEDYVSPRQTGYESTLGTTINYYQFFRPFTSSISTTAFYISGTFGTPSNIIVTILETVAGTSGSFIGASTLSIDTLSPAIGWNTIPINRENIKSKKEYIFKISNTGIIDYFNLGASTTATSSYCKDELGNTAPFNLAFKINCVNRLVSKAYPSTTISDENYPLITTDITGRPRVIQNYIDPRRIEENITFTAYVFSKHTDELDLLCTMIEDAMFKRREKIAGIFIISPGNTTMTNRYRETLFERDINFNVRMFLNDV